MLRKLLTSNLCNRTTLGSKAVRSIRAIFMETHAAMRGHLIFLLLLQFFFQLSVMRHDSVPRLVVCHARSAGAMYRSAVDPG